VPSLPTRASVVVVGGGVIGASIAFHLAEAGVEGVVLLERGALGGGSTGRAAGGIRTQFSDALNVRLAKRSRDAYARFGERPGAEIDYRADGYLFLLDEAGDVDAFAAAIELQAGLGLRTELIEPAAAAALCPLLDTDGLLAAAHSPDDARATPDAVTQGYAAGARAHGAQVLTGCEATGILVEGGEIVAVRTPAGTIATGAVVCAAGAWSGACAALAGVDLPVTPVRTRVLLTEPLAQAPPDMPLTVDFSRRYYLHPEGPGLLVGYTEPDEPAGFDAQETDAWLDGLLAAAARRTPAVATCGVRGGWSGLFENTPDHNALIGEADDVARLLYATGFSGHGFMQAPAVGEVVRDLYLDREPFADVGPLAAGRFAAGQARPERAVV
jgi:sarcosine oxidase subunit beta